MFKIIKVPLVLEPQKEGGWMVASPILPELITEVDNLKKLNDVDLDAINTVAELYDDMDRVIPAELVGEGKTSIWFESLIPVEE